jgi:hypothetical protein
VASWPMASGLFSRRASFICLHPRGSAPGRESTQRDDRRPAHGEDIGNIRIPLDVTDRMIAEADRGDEELRRTSK